MTERTRGREDGGTGEEEAPSVTQVRGQIAVTRRQLSRDLDEIEARLRGIAYDVRERLDVLEPARESIRAQVWTSLALAFGAGVACAVLTARRHDGRRGAPGHVLHSAAARLPGAIYAGARAGVAERLRHYWTTRVALPAGPTTEGADGA